MNSKKETPKAISIRRVRRLRKVAVNIKESIAVKAIKMDADFLHKVVLNNKIGIGNIGLSQRDNRSKRADAVHKAIDPANRANERFIEFFGSTPMTDIVTENVTKVAMHRPAISTQNSGGIFYLSSLILMLTLIKVAQKEVSESMQESECGWVWLAKLFFILLAGIKNLIRFQDIM